MRARTGSDSYPEGCTGRGAAGGVAAGGGVAVNGVFVGVLNARFSGGGVFSPPRPDRRRPRRIGCIESCSERYGLNGRGTGVTFPSAVESVSMRFRAMLLMI